MLSVVQSVENDFAQLVAGHLLSLSYLSNLYVPLSVSVRLSPHTSFQNKTFFSVPRAYRGLFGLAYFQVYLGKQEANET